MLIDNVQIKSIDANKVTENSNKRFVSDYKISEWDNKSDWHSHPYASDTHVNTIADQYNLGHIMSGGDISIDRYGTVSVNDDSHKHTMSTISGFDEFFKTKFRVVNGYFNGSRGAYIPINGTPLSGTSYHVTITPTQDPDGSLGEIYVSERTTKSFTVYNTGSFTGSFTALIVDL